MGKVIEQKEFVGFDCDLCGEHIRNKDPKLAYKLLMQHLSDKHPKQQKKTVEFKDADKAAKSLEDRVAELERQMIKLKEALV